VKIHHLTVPPPEWLGVALEEFERQFYYPLGPGRSFRISHGREYVTFFQAMGQAHVFVAEREGVVLGTLAAVLRPVRFPDGETHPVVYLCDLKMAPAARYGKPLALLMQAARDVLAGDSGGRGYGVVMDGTRRTPERYTGRAGLPLFASVGSIAILRMPVEAGRASRSRIAPMDSIAWGQVEGLHEQLAGDGYRPLGGQPTRRSEFGPLGVMQLDGDACGLIEDTQRGKRLFDQAEVEMQSVHLSHFAYCTVEHAVQLLHGTLDMLRHFGYSAVFTSVAPADAPEIVQAFPGTIVAPATVYATGPGLMEPAPWRIDTSEI
jgi:hypothetical protein